MHRIVPIFRTNWEDALPDFVIGLVGIPVAFALQEVASKTLKISTFTKLNSHSSAYFNFIDSSSLLFLFCVYFLIGAYFLFSFLILDAARKSHSMGRRYVIVVYSISFVLVMLFVATIVMYGKFFPDNAVLYHDTDKLQAIVPFVVFTCIVIYLATGPSILVYGPAISQQIKEFALYVWPFILFFPGFLLSILVILFSVFTL